MANMGKVYTYGELDALTVRFASFLQNTLKLPMGARVAVMMPNLLQYPVAVFAIPARQLHRGQRQPAAYPARELEHQLNDAGVDTIVILENFANAATGDRPYGGQARNGVDPHWRLAGRAQVLAGELCRR